MYKKTLDLQGLFSLWGDNKGYLKPYSKVDKQLTNINIPYLSKYSIFYSIFYTSLSSFNEEKVFLNISIYLSLFETIVKKLES